MDVFSATHQGDMDVVVGKQLQKSPCARDHQGIGTGIIMDTCNFLVDTVAHGVTKQIEIGLGAAGWSAMQNNLFVDPGHLDDAGLTSGAGNIRVDLAIEAGAVGVMGQ